MTAISLDQTFHGVMTRHQRRAKRRFRRAVALLVWASLGTFFGSAAVISEFTNAQLISRMVLGNAVVNDGLIARDIMDHRSKWLTFWVAGRKYQVFSPYRTTPTEEAALLRYAARMRMPLWAADGRLAIDP